MVSLIPKLLNARSPLCQYVAMTLEAFCKGLKRCIKKAGYKENVVPKAGLEPARVTPLPPQDSVSTRFHHFGILKILKKVKIYLAGFAGSGLSGLNGALFSGSAGAFCSITTESPIL